eukprot:353484-Chlamydomonas_euryale.AAC.3
MARAWSAALRAIAAAGDALGTRSAMGSILQSETHSMAISAARPVCLVGTGIRAASTVAMPSAAATEASTSGQPQSTTAPPSRFEH